MLIEPINTRDIPRFYLNRQDDAHALIAEVVSWSNVARKEGLLALESRIPQMEDPFIQKGLQLLVDGANHGGLWRVPYLPRSVLPFAALLGLMKRR